jgi:hypothetical protein
MIYHCIPNGMHKPKTMTMPSADENMEKLACSYKKICCETLENCLTVPPSPEYAFAL